MRTSWWAYVFVGVLTCSAAYQHFDRRALATASSGASEQPLTHKDEARLQEVDSALAGLEPAQLPNVQKEARLEDTTGAVTVKYSELNEPKQNLSYLAYYVYSELPPETKPADTVLNSLK